MTTPRELELLKNSTSYIIPKLYDEEEKRRFLRAFNYLMRNKKPILIKGVYSKGTNLVEIIFDVIEK